MPNEDTIFDFIDQDTVFYNIPDMLYARYVDTRDSITVPDDIAVYEPTADIQTDKPMHRIRDAEDLRRDELIAINPEAVDDPVGYVERVIRDSPSAGDVASIDYAHQQVEITEKRTTDILHISVDKGWEDLESQIRALDNTALRQIEEMLQENPTLYQMVGNELDYRERQKENR